MKAVIYRSFKGPIQIENLPDPVLPIDGVIIQVGASGLCRSDWHGWQGHDGDIQLPQVPGHELAGTVIEVGKLVRKWKIGDRVTVPFCCGCGYCKQCNSGNQQICDHYFQPGFTAWGSFAQFVAIRYADENLVALPENMSFASAAVLGCRFITAYRGIVTQGKLGPGKWLAIFGCGGVGLSGIAIGQALGAKVIAIDINPLQLEKAKAFGAHTLINPKKQSNVPEWIKQISHGGVHVSVDALGHTTTCIQSILSLRKQGKHIQLGLMAGEHQTPPIPMAPIIANELEILGSHGMQAHQYPALFQFIENQKIPIDEMIGNRIHLDEAPLHLVEMNKFQQAGITVITSFD